MTSLSIENYTGVSVEIFKAIGGKNAKQLTGQNASIFEKVDKAIKEIKSEDISFSKIFSTLYDLLSDVIKNGLYSTIRLIKNISNSIINYFSQNNLPKKDNIRREDVVSSCKDYLHKVNDQKTGNILFSEERIEYWCADTVSKIYEDLLGDKLPKNFGSSAVSGLKAFGEREKCYTETSTMTKQKRAQWILENVKPGDIMIQKRNGVSHTGIIEEVIKNEDGSVTFKTLEGNYSKKFSEVTRSSDDKGLSGFISMAKWIEE